ncbi:D-serine dehydratase-like isoform X1 [Oscarella lobularis]|uniref:D-serine dehydratase-like isoform X1 n=2 Tax=Oscarella lobularis TaxID=121494 RepID=UPI0033144D49
MDRLLAGLPWDKSFTPQHVSSLQTPAFLVDVPTLKQNCQTMIERCARAGVNLRPHMKTAKTWEAGFYMTNETRRRITVSTIGEASFFAEGGFDDILLAFPMTKNKLKPVAKLMQQLEQVHIVVDSKEAVKAIKDFDGRLPVGRKWSVLVIVDVGYGRLGVPIADSAGILELIRDMMDSEEIQFSGLYTHTGQAYDARESGQVQKLLSQTVESISDLAKKIRASGIDCPIVSIGSTPTCSVAKNDLGAVTEIHPGNYIFYDWEQRLIGSCTESEIACTVQVTVMSHYPSKGHMVIDSGWTGMSLDKDRNETGYGAVVRETDLELFSMSQEVGKVRSKSGSLNYEKYPIGSSLWLYPYHSCATAYHHPRYFICEGETVIDEWIPHRGW